MISMRYHIVSIAGVFLALALGIVLGATKVQGPILAGATDDRTQLTQQRDQLQSDNQSLQVQLNTGEKFADDVSALAVRGTLPKQTVVLISTQDADPGDRDALLGLLARAGATVTAQLALTADFTDPARSSELQSLVAKSLPAGAKLPDVASSGTMAGVLLGAVLVTDKDNKATSQPAEATAAMSALSSGGFVTADGTLAPGRLVIVLTGGAQSGGSETDRSAVLSDLASQLRKSAGGVVLAGSAGSATETGVVGTLRADSTAASAVSTVDDVDSSVGRIGAVLALVEQAGGGVGQYGTGSGAAAPIPVLAVG
ncbi:copper transporter [Nakamurella sp. A5-74]|uniref:Copper transporter n=1 Tax=Nakamurella sp. A5-74 TaxID=3158264 RepID=A0AAU8DMU3_9ACTN